MSNSIVRMETSSVSTSPRCPSFCSQLHYKSKALNGRSHKQLTDSRQPRENKEIDVCEVMRSLCVCVFQADARPVGYVHTHPCPTAVWRRQRAAVWTLTFSGRRSWDSAVHWFLTSVCGMGMRKPRAPWRSTVSSSISLEKKSMCAQAHAHVWINKYWHLLVLWQVCHTTERWTSIYSTPAAQPQPV